MLKYIGDFEKLKDYGFRKVNSKNNGFYSDAYIKEFENNEIIVSFSSDIKGELELNLFGENDLDDGVVNTLYELIKDGLVIEEANE